MLYYFCYIMHFHYLLQEVSHIWYQSTLLAMLGGISANFFSFVVLPDVVIIAVVILLCIFIFISIASSD